MKQRIKINESTLNRIIKESLKKVLSEEIDGNEEEYNPWLNGDASWIEGSYDIPYGFHVEIDARYCTVSIEDIDENGEVNEENSYFLQGDDATELITDISRYWSEGDCTPEDAVNAVISGMF